MEPFSKSENGSTCGKLFVDLLGKIFHANLLAYEHLLMLIRMMQMRDHSISVDQARYATSIVAKYLNKILLWLSIWILPQLRQAQRMFKANFHMIQYSTNLIDLLVMSKLRSLLENSIFNAKLVLYH